VRTFSSDITGIAWSADGKYIVACGREKRIAVFDAKTQQYIATLVGHSWIVHSISISSNSQLICTSAGIWDKRCIVWDLSKVIALQQFNQADMFVPPHSDLVMASDVSPDFKLFASGAFDHLHKVSVLLYLN
jgi:WD40 repeat protein